MGWNYPHGPGDPFDYVNLEPFGDEYVIVTTHKERYPYLVKQWYFGAEQGMKLRSGTIAEDGTVTWEDWKCDSDFLTQTQLEETFVKKEEGLAERVTALETVNQDLENIIALQQSYIGGDGA